MLYFLSWVLFVYFASCAFFTWRSPRRLDSKLLACSVAFSKVYADSFIFLRISSCSKIRLCISLIRGVQKFRSWPLSLYVGLNSTTPRVKIHSKTKLVCELRKRRMAREHSLRLLFYIAVHSGLSSFCSVSPWLVLFGIPCRF